MNHTTNYQLNQWDAEDKVQRTDFNADNAKIDAALKDHDDALAAERSARESGQQSVSAELAKKGNCKIDLFPYTGTGTFGPNTPTVIQFPQRPTIFFITAPTTFAVARAGAVQGQVMYKSTMSDVNIAWSGSTVSLTTNNGQADWQLNAKGVMYFVTALYSLS